MLVHTSCQVWKAIQVLAFLTLVFASVPASATSPGFAKVLTVAADGSGEFTTIQSAIDTIPRSNRDRVLIEIRDGVYHEKVLIVPDRITLRGQSRKGTQLKFYCASRRVRPPVRRHRPRSDERLWRRPGHPADDDRKHAAQRNTCLRNLRPTQSAHSRRLRSPRLRRRYTFALEYAARNVLPSQLPLQRRCRLCLSPRLVFHPRFSVPGGRPQSQCYGTTAIWTPA